MAAKINGTLSHALDYDDTHFDSMGHTSVAVIPAALSLADKMSVQPKAFLEAVLIGVELAVRIGSWLGRSHYHAGFHMTATAGTFGAAMASARILGLSSNQTRHALGIAASMASGIKTQFGTMGKPLHAGLAAHAGVDAALLAYDGFVATHDGLEGEQGFSPTHHGAGDTGAFDGMGRDFVFERVSHKYHACCHGIHATLEALAILRDRISVQPEEIAELAITVSPQYLNVCNIASPVTGLEAKFSYRLVAALFMHGYDTARIETYNDAICQDVDVLRLRDRVVVATNTEISDAAAMVDLKLANGHTHSQSFDLTDPVPLAAREARVRAKAASLIGAAEASSLWQKVGLGEQLPSHWIANQSLP
jgi:2-methylcitrate dehydratase PrpD